MLVLYCSACSPNHTLLVAMAAHNVASCLYLFKDWRYLYQFYWCPMVTAPTGSYTFSLPHSTGRSTSKSLSEFTTMVAIDASMCCVVEPTIWCWPCKDNYHFQNDTLRSIEATIGTLKSEVTAKFLAHGASLDATYKLAQDSMDSSNRTRILVQDMSSDVAVLKLEFEAMKVVLMEIRDTLLPKAQM